MGDGGILVISKNRLRMYLLMYDVQVEYLELYPPGMRFLVRMRSGLDRGVQILLILLG